MSHTRLKSLESIQAHAPRACFWFCNTSSTFGTLAEGKALPAGIPRTHGSACARLRLHGNKTWKSETLRPFAQYLALVLKFKGSIPSYRYYRSCSATVISTINVWSDKERSRSHICTDLWSTADSLNLEIFAPPVNYTVTVQPRHSTTSAELAWVREP